MSNAKTRAVARKHRKSRQRAKQRIRESRAKAKAHQGASPAKKG
jgi:hypothetical protein